MVVSWPERIDGSKVASGRSSRIASTLVRRSSKGRRPRAPRSWTESSRSRWRGTSFLYNLDDAEAAEQHTVQYFEMYGNRAIYKDGWWAACMLDRIPWDASPPSIGRFAPGLYDPEQDKLGALLPTRRLLPGEGPRRGAAGEAGGAQGTLLAGSREAQRAAAARRGSRSSSGSCRHCRRSPRTRSTATSRTSRPA